MIRTLLKKVLPIRFVERYRAARRVMRGETTWPPADIYEQLYEIHSLASSDSDAVGRGSFDTIGMLELALLQHEGLKPSHTLVDFGCGTGRLAVHALPALSGGHYVGIDISSEMLRRLDIRLKELPTHACRVSLVHQRSDIFPLADKSADMLCAFSVFTHMEHEDSFRYLRDARRVVRPGGRMVFSCLTLDSSLGKSVFLESASVDVQLRWATVRSVGTSRDFMVEIARLAGWTLVRWHHGEEAAISLPGRDKPLPFGQSIGIFE